MTENLPEKSYSGRNVLLSGIVLGIGGVLFLWLANDVSPGFLLPALILGPIIGGFALGAPALMFERKVLRERKAYQAEQAQIRAANAAARRSAAAQAAAPTVVVNLGGAYPAAGGAAGAPAPAVPSGGPSGAPSWTPLSGTPSAPVPAKVAPKVPSWPLTEPLVVLEASKEDDVWAVVKAAVLSPERVVAFTTDPPAEVAATTGFPTSTFRRITRVEGEENYSPGDLERIGNVIERHLDGGEGRIVVLPGLENLVEAGNVRHVRRLLEVLRDLALSSKGSILVSLDPVSLPESSVTLLERGAFKLAS